MKQGHKKTRSEQRHDFQSLQERIDKWKFPQGPFDWHTRGQAVTETLQFCNEASQMRQRHPHDREIGRLHVRATQLFHVALETAYPPDFDDTWNKISKGDATGLEGAVQFLEADPMFFRTGYLKAKLTRYIKSPMITPAYAFRLRSVVLSLVDRRDDRDFRAYCRLARKVDAPELRQALTQRLMHTDPNIRRRARWMLDALEQSR